MNISVDYYQLKEDKEMGDGTMIPKDLELIFIKKEDGHIQFEFTEGDCKTFFWAVDDEVYFLETKEEDWSQEKITERNLHINGEFL